MTCTISFRQGVKIMQCNVGPKERVARIGAGVVAGGVAVSGLVPLWGQVLLGIVGVTGLATGVTRYCPANQLLGYNGCAPEGKKTRRILK